MRVCDRRSTGDPVACRPLQPLRSDGNASSTGRVGRMSITVESTARAMADAVRRGEISARELLELHLARIAERNPELNAIV